MLMWYAVIAVFIGVLILYGIHKFLLWAEEKGYIYYMKKHGSTDRIGMAMLEMQSMLEPSKKHVTIVKKDNVVQRDAQGDPSEPGPLEELKDDDTDDAT